MTDVAIVSVDKELLERAKKIRAERIAKDLGISEDAGRYTDDEIVKIALLAYLRRGEGQAR